MYQSLNDDRILTTVRVYMILTVAANSLATVSFKRRVLTVKADLYQQSQEIYQRM